MLPTSQPTFLKSNTYQLIFFIKSPKQISNNLTSKLQLLLYCFILQCFVILFDLLNLSFFEFLETIKFFENIKLVISENPEEVKFKSQIIFFIVACFVGPFFEEIIYRLPLLKKYSYLLLLPLFSFYFYDKTGFSLIINGTLVLTLLSYLVYYYLNTKHISHFSFHHFVGNYRNTIYGSLYPFLFYALALIFSFSHIDNYYWCSTNFLSGSLIIFSIFFSHILYGYLILNCGFWYAVLLHCVQNIIVSLIP